MLHICITLESIWQHKTDIKKKNFQGWNCHNFKVNLTFCPQIFALLCQILSRQTFTHVLTFMSKNPQHDCVKTRGGQGPFTQCVKKHPIWWRMASLRLVWLYISRLKIYEIIDLSWSDWISHGWKFYEIFDLSWSD